MKFEWEGFIFHSSDIATTQTLRLKVFGGWILSKIDAVHTENNAHMCTSMVFIPDHNHEWVIE
jgi:hypothetical protein